MLLANTQARVPQTAATSGHMRPFPISTDIRRHPAIPGIGRSYAPGCVGGFANSITTCQARILAANYANFANGVAEAEDCIDPQLRAIRGLIIPTDHAGCWQQPVARAH